jgi:alpha-tubulin suppressor-like RCC1 family protein
LRTQRIWTLIAGATAVGAIAATTISGAGTEAVAAQAPAQQAPAIQPAVLQQSTLVEGQSRKDRRTLQSGVTILDGQLYLWGWGVCGALGTKGSANEESCLSTSWTTPDNRAPTTVVGLPNGAIQEVTGGIYNYNALDTAGYVWGWGSHANRDGTGVSAAARNSDTGNAKYGAATGASWPPKRLRIGASWDDSCMDPQAPHVSASIKTNCGKPYLGEGDPVTLLSSTEMAGAAVTKSGLVYSWGGFNYGGVGEGDLTGLNGKWNRYGAVQVQFPADFDVTEDGNQPVQLEGGYQTYWLLLENGEVWYFGGNPNTVWLGGGSPWERSIGDQQTKYSGRTSVAFNAYPDGVGQIAVKSTALAPWFREANNPDGYIVQVHSGISYGAALLSTGRMLTWGDGAHRGALGRKCPTSPTSAAEACAHTPTLVEFDKLGANPNIVQFSCSFSAVTALAEDGTLYGWGVPERSYEGYPSDGGGRGTEVYEYGSSNLFTGYLPADRGAIIVVDRNVVDFQTGQGFVIWWDVNGKQWGRGWHEHGSLGHHGGNWGRPGFFNETRKRWVWFTEPQYEDCQYNDQSSGYGSWPSDEAVMFKTTVKNKYNGVDYYCSDLNLKDPNTGAWLHRFSLEQCLEGKCDGP